VTVLPKLALPAAHSPLAAGFRKSQSGKKLVFVSVHVRCALLTDVASGSAAAASVVVSLATYRARVPLSAVRPLPNRSYAMPNRGETFFHSGTPATSGKSRSPMKRVGGCCCAGTLELR